MENREEFIQAQLHAFLSAMYDIESLAEFYHRSSKTVDTFAKDQEKECEVGLRIGQLFNEVVDCKGKDARNKKIDEIKGVPVDGSTELQEIVNVLYFSGDEQTLQFTMKEDYTWNYLYSPNEAHRKMNSISGYRTILIETVLSHIQVIYEKYLGSILHTLILAEPLKYIGNETISFAEVINNSKEAIRNKIGSIVESKLWDSLELLKSLGKTEGIEINRYGDITSIFEEVYYRRNAYIHTEGRVNKDYLSKVDKTYTKDLKIRDLLKCDENYIENAIVNITELIFMIQYELFKKEKVQDEIKSISDYFFDKLRKKEYEISKFVYKALSQYDLLDFADRTKFRINYINACKQLGDDKTVSKELRKLDVSAMQEQFVIAKLCLENNTEAISDHLDRTYPNSYNAKEIRDWPIFINFRETEQYKSFREKYSADFNVQELEQEATEYELIDEGTLSCEVRSEEQAGDSE